MWADSGWQLYRKEDDFLPWPGRIAAGTAWVKRLATVKYGGVTIWLINQYIFKTSRKNTGS